MMMMRYLEEDGNIGNVAPEVSDRISTVTSVKTKYYETNKY